MGQLPIPPTPEGTSVAGKTIIVTGGNSGLGLEAARQFLVLGCSRMILACRSLTRGRQAVAFLQADPEVQRRNPNTKIEVFELDLDDYESGMRFVKRVAAEVPELDILMNNGGMSTLRRESSASGHERTMQVNCYTHILVSLELMPLLRKTAAARGSPTRITFVGSGMQSRAATLNGGGGGGGGGGSPIPEGTSILRYFDDPASFDRFRRYGDSKLLVNAYVRRLAALAPGEVIVNNACPGMIRSGLDGNLPLPLKLLVGLVRNAWGRTVEEGTRVLIYAAAVAGAETNGKFMQNNQVAPGAPFLNGPNAERFVDRLWKETVEDLVKVDPALGRFA